VVPFSLLAVVVVVMAVSWVLLFELLQHLDAILAEKDLH
jgi:hypothetical protein